MLVILFLYHGRHTMISSTETYYCPCCKHDMPHIVVLVRKESPFKNDKHQKRKEFLSGLLQGMLFGAFMSSMDQFSRHIICSECGRKFIED